MKNIVIVGSSGGIGQYLCNHLDGNIVRVSRSENRGNYYQVDVTKPQELMNCAFQVERKFGKVDALIFCAGTQGYIGKAMNTGYQEWANAVNVNLVGLFNTVKAFHGSLTDIAIPRIIAMSGGGATKARQRFSAYASAKCGMVRLVETLAEEMPELRINAVAPGAIATNMMTEVLEAGERAGAKEVADAQKAQKEPIETLALTKFLLSDEGVNITGRLIAAKWDRWYEPNFYMGNVGTLRRVEAV